MSLYVDNNLYMHTFKWLNLILELSGLSLPFRILYPFFTTTTTAIKSNYCTQGFHLGESRWLFSWGWFWTRIVQMWPSCLLQLIAFLGSKDLVYRSALPVWDLYFPLNTIIQFSHCVFWNLWVIWGYTICPDIWCSHLFTL